MAFSRSAAIVAPVLFLTAMTQAPPPHPAAVPPNASRIFATVLNYAVWPPGSLQQTGPQVPRGQTLYSLTVEIHTADSEQAGLKSLARPGVVIEAFSADVLAADLVGAKIHATLTLTGDTRGVRWWISHVRARP